MELDVLSGRAYLEVEKLIDLGDLSRNVCSLLKVLFLHISNLQRRIFNRT